MKLIERFKERSPEYSASYEPIIDRFTLTQGGKAGTATDDSAWSQGKYFMSKYEIFIYAAILGLRSSYRLPLSSGPKKTFWEIKNWKPLEVVDYLIMMVIAQSDISLSLFEELSDDAVDEKLTELKRVLEEYANGGFDKIRAKMDSDPVFFQHNDNCFYDLLEICAP